MLDMKPRQEQYEKKKTVLWVNRETQFFLIYVGQKIWSLQEKTFDKRWHTCMTF